MPSGARIQLQADPEADERDMYGRLLRIIYMDDGREYNQLMVKEGFAYAYIRFPMNKNFKRELKESERDARMAERGLWSPMTCHGAP